MASWLAIEACLLGRENGFSALLLKGVSLILRGCTGNGRAGPWRLLTAFAVPAGEVDEGSRISKDPLIVSLFFKKKIASVASSRLSC